MTLEKLMCSVTNINQIGETPSANVFGTPLGFNAVYSYVATDHYRRHVLTLT